jgi:hypothetical protein
MIGPNVDLRYHCCGLAAPKPNRYTAPLSIPDTLLTIQSHRKAPLSPAKRARSG